MGDRYVARSWPRATGINVGGEQSGHLILSDFATTGDGLLAALQVLAVLVQRQRQASETCRILEAVAAEAEERPLQRPITVAANPKSRETPSERLSLNLEGTGRVLIRESGTEPVIRVMAEAEDASLVHDMVETLATPIAVADRERLPAMKGRVLSSPARTPAAARASRPTSRRSPRWAALPPPRHRADRAEHEGVHGVCRSRSISSASRSSVVLHDIGADA